MTVRQAQAPSYQDVFHLVHVRNDQYTMFRDCATDLLGVEEFYSEPISIPVGR
jgi:hypothetical protein